MATPRTMLTNVRTALRSTTQAWHDVHRESERNRHLWTNSSDSFKKRLRDSLNALYLSKNGSALFRETVRMQHPQVLPLVLQYGKEKQEASTWLSKHQLVNLEKKLQRAQSDRDALQENTRRSSPALHNHMYQIEELLREAAKAGLAAPERNYEQSPEDWLAYLTAIERQLEKEETQVGFWQKLMGTAKTLHSAARNIEKSTREGFPTMMLHVRESLDLQRRLIDHYHKSEREAAAAIDNIEKYKYYEQRLAELENLGEAGYLLTHAKEDSQLTTIVSCIDAEFGGAVLANLLRQRTLYAERQSGIEMAHAMLSGWNETMQTIENILSRKEKDTTDYAEDPLADMCAAARKGSNTVQRWLLTIMDSEMAAISPVMNEGPIETDRMITILRDIDNKLSVGYALFSNHPVLLNN